jgi:hypothetical protein
MAGEVDVLAADVLVVAVAFVAAVVAVVVAVAVVVVLPLSRRAIASAFPSAVMRRRDEPAVPNGSRKMPTVCRRAMVNTTIATAATEPSGNRRLREYSDALTRTNGLSFDMGTPFERTFGCGLGRWQERTTEVSFPEPRHPRTEFST